MSVPKKHKTSSARNRGRSHHALKKIHLVSCPKCKTRILPHRICPTCGYYKGQEIIKLKTVSDKKAAKKKAKEEAQAEAKTKTTKKKEA